MSGYPNILTPPMDSPEFLILSPHSDGSSRSPPSQLAYTSPMRLLSVHGERSPDMVNRATEPWLEILEDPVEKFRFRYKSEMAGTHGSLNGRNSDRSRKQTYPCVKLHNFNQPAIVRCSIYQISRSEPHAHRLVKRSGPDEVDDPHDLEVGPEVGYKANFTNMGIIHTAKKYIVGELSRKYSVLKREAIVREEGIERSLTSAEESEIRQKAQGEANHINLNQVCLKFDAFKKEGKAMLPICQSVYSGTINNLKSALTGDLKIVRMDHCTSGSRGGREIFILVEKVTKKNIKVRFFECDDEDNEVWSDYGRFSDLDVHHQYAIVFKTPPYRIIDIDKQVKVFIELQRPSDNARSEAKDFTYTPCEIIQGRKRARNSYNSYSSSSSFSSRELPAILPNPDYIVNSKDLDDALHNNDVNSEEFQKLCNQLMVSGGKGFQELYIDSTISMDGPRSFTSNQTPAINSQEDGIIRRVESEIRNLLISLKHPSDNCRTQRIPQMLKYILSNPRYKLENGNTILHMLISKNNYKEDFLITLLKLLNECNLSSMINMPNRTGQTALHLAVTSRNRKIIELLLEAKADLSAQDLQGNTPLHIAIMTDIPQTMLHLIFSYKSLKSFVNLKNNEGNTALHLAVKTNNTAATEILCANEADVDLPSNTNGYTPLHMAVADQHIDIVKFLLDSNCDTSFEDFSGSNAIKLAKVLIDPDRPVTKDIYLILENFMKKLGIFEEVLIKEEDGLDDTSDVEDMIKCEPGPIPLDSLQLKYKRMTVLPEECSKRIADILNASGSWQKLADRLDYGHMVRSNMFAEDANPAKSCLDFVMANGEELLRLRTVLNTLGETRAVNILDNIVKQEADTTI